jgi:hypothetical protein
MEWHTEIPIEILEQVLLLTRSPSAVARCSSVCTNWKIIAEDPQLWKVLTIFNLCFVQYIHWRYHS